MQRKSALGSTHHLLIVLTLTSEIVGCAGPESDRAIETHERVLELSADLASPREVGTDDYLGTSMDALLEQETVDAEAPYRHSAAGCIIDHYGRDGFVIAVDEHCAASHRRLFFYETNSEMVARSFADADADGLVDAWFDAATDTLIEDDNHDGIVDRITAPAVEEDRVLLELFDDSWTPPEHLDTVMFEDGDFDRGYDVVTIAAGRNADGVQTYWVSR